MKKKKILSFHNAERALTAPNIIWSYDFTWVQHCASDFFLFYLINELVVEMWHLQVSQTALRLQHISRGQVLLQQEVHLKQHTGHVASTSDKGTEMNTRL